MISPVIDNSDPLVFSDKEIRSLYECRSLVLRVRDFALSILRQLCLFLLLAWNSLSFDASKLKNPTWNEESRGLVVMIHGLNNSPTHWFRHIKEVKKEEGIDLYTPAVLKRGNVTADEAVTPILKRIVSYVKKHPGKPVCLLGISNGGRLTTLIEAALRKQAVRTPVKVSNISGAHYGTSLVTLGNRLGLTYFLTTSPVRDELSYGSETAKAIVSKAQQPMPYFTAARDFEYFASTEDIVIPDLSSTLPKLNHPARYRVVHGHSHDSIVLAVAKDQIEQCVNWINQQQPSLAGRLAASLLA